MIPELQDKSPADKYREELAEELYWLDALGEGLACLDGSYPDNMTYKEAEALLKPEWERVKK